jgi:hypothetical protein
LQALENEKAKLLGREKAARYAGIREGKVIHRKQLTRSFLSAII